MCTFWRFRLRWRHEKYHYIIWPCFSLYLSITNNLVHLLGEKKYSLRSTGKIFIDKVGIFIFWNVLTTLGYWMEYCMIASYLLNNLYWIKRTSDYWIIYVKWRHQFYNSYLRLTWYLFVIIMYQFLKKRKWEIYLIR